METDGNKLISQLELIDEISDGFSFPVEDPVMTYRATIAQLTNHIRNELMNDLVPAGVIAAYAGSTPPEGWILIHNDNTFIDPAQFPRLFDAIGYFYGERVEDGFFKLPPLSGLGLRFAGSQTLNGKFYSGDLGVRRNDNMQSHFHGYLNDANYSPNGAYGGSGRTVAGNWYDRNILTTSSAGSGSQTHGADIAFYGIIKY